MDPETATRLLGTWAASRPARQVRRPLHKGSWEAVKKLIAVAQAKQAVDAQRLRALLEESNKLLDPLADPLTLDLGLHRWLAGEREEAYSDWLQWVVQQLGRPDRVFRLFSLPLPSGW